MALCPASWLAGRGSVAEAIKATVEARVIVDPPPADAAAELVFVRARRTVRKKSRRASTTPFSRSSPDMASN